MTVKLARLFLVALLGAACSSLLKVANLSDVADLSTITKGPAAISTSFADADKGQALEDNFNDKARPKPLAALPQTPEGAYKLAPGFYEITCKSYCLHAGTHAPSAGDGYLSAPLKGPRKEIIQALLRNSARRPSVRQQDVQLLIWAVLAKANFKQLSPALQVVSAQLLSPKELFALNGGVLGILPETALSQLKQGLPPAAQRVLEAENKMRALFGRGISKYEEFRALAVLPGAAPVDNPQYKRGRWCRHPNGFYIRFFPTEYASTRVQLYVPKATSSGKQSVRSSPAYAGLLPQWPNIDLTDIVAVPANSAAQRLGLGGSGYAGGGGESGGGGSSDSYGDPEQENTGPPDNPQRPTGENPPKGNKGERPKDGKAKGKNDKPKPKSTPPEKTEDKEPPTGNGPDKNGPDKQGDGGRSGTGRGQQGGGADKGKGPKGRGTTAGEVDDDYVRDKLPDCFKEALKKFGKTEAEIVEYFKNYHNERCEKRFFDDIDELLKNNNPSGLTDCNAYALWGYTTNFFYRDLNKWLREGQNKAQTKEITRIMEQGLAKMPNYKGKHVYRGIEIDAGELQQFLADYRAGSEHTWANFTSCGGTKDGSFAGRPRVNVVFEIAHKTGKDISELADGIRCGEPPMPPPEILIKSNSTVKSTANPVYDSKTNKWLIKVTQTN